jgi:hypothetical protein
MAGPNGEARADADTGAGKIGGFPASPPKR